MGKRSRRTTHGAAAPKKDAARDHMARVRVTDEVWADFRTLAGQTPVSFVLADLVEREVRRYRERRIRDGQADDQELLDALDRAQQLHGELGAVVESLERRLDRAAG